MGQWMNGYLEKLEGIRRENLAGGGEEKMAELAGFGKRSARERIDRLADSGSFEEFGAMVRDHRSPFDGQLRPSPSEGIVMGAARIGGRPVMVYAFDASVMSGSLGDQAAWKLADLVQMAGERKMPLVGVVDSAGERLSLKGGDSGLNGVGTLLRNFSTYSGVIPKITVLLGPCTGLLATMAVLPTFSSCTRKMPFSGSGARSNPMMREGANFTWKKAASATCWPKATRTPWKKARALLEFLPQSCWDTPPRTETEDAPDRRDESLLDVMPDDVKFTYDIHEVIERIVDDGEFFELKEDFAAHLVVGFARFDGRTVGIVANNPDELSGIMEPDSSDKYDRFMNILDAFNIPLLTLVDTTAFPPGDRWERDGGDPPRGQAAALLRPPDLSQDHHGAAPLLRRGQHRHGLFEDVSRLRFCLAHGGIRPHRPGDRGPRGLSPRTGKGERKGELQRGLRHVPRDFARTVFRAEPGQALDHLLHGPRGDRSARDPAANHSRPGAAGTEKGEAAGKAAVHKTGLILADWLFLRHKNGNC